MVSGSTKAGPERCGPGGQKTIGCGVDEEAVGEVSRADEGVEASIEDETLLPRPRWFAVMTKVRKEGYARDNLARQGYRTFFPHYQEWTRPKKTKPRLLTKPRMPRYIFVAMEGKPNQSFYNVNNTYGVSHMVYYGENPLPISEEIMNSLMEMADENGRFLSEGDKKPPFPGKTGDWLEYFEGHPLFGFATELLRVDKSGQLVVKLSQMLGVDREITVHRDDVRRITPKETA